MAQAASAVVCDSHTPYVQVDPYLGSVKRGQSKETEVVVVFTDGELQPLFDEMLGGQRREENSR
jgi:hypothetical protein